MASIPLPIASDPARSQLVNGPLLKNCYAELAPEGSATKFAIYRSPGLTPFYSGSGASSRGLFPLINVNGTDTLLSVHGNTLYEIDEDGAASARGNIFGTGEVIFARNMKATPQVAIVTVNEGAYILENDAVTEITDSDLPDPNSVDFLNGYFLFGIDDGRFFGSNLNEGTAISALNFGTADGHPDGLRRLFVHAQQVYLFGASSTEVWVYDDREEFPFRRLPGAVIQAGLASREAVGVVSGKMYFVDNTGIVRRLDPGYTPVRISNVGVEEDIGDAIQAGETLYVWGYLDGGHEFVVVGADSFTWVFDNVLGEWHNRETYRYDHWQARHYAYCFGKHIVASSISGKLHELSKSTYDEDGDDLIWTVRTPLLNGFPNGAALHELNLHVETGMGLGASGASEDQNPVLMMRMTKDGYKTWTSERQISLGTQGQYRKTVRFNRLGSIGRQGVAFEFSASAAVATAIIQADVRGDPRAG